MKLLRSFFFARSWKQLIRWLDAPRFVSAGDDIQAGTADLKLTGAVLSMSREVLACYNDHQVIDGAFMLCCLLERSIRGQRGGYLPPT